MYTYADFERMANQAGLMGQFSQYDLDLARNNPQAGIGILQAKIDHGKATTDAERAAANAAAEAIRSQYGGYTGGSWGNSYTPVQQQSQSAYTVPQLPSLQAPAVTQAPTYTPSVSTTAPTYTPNVPQQAPTYNPGVSQTAPVYNSQYMEQINQQLQDLLNRPEFSYDKEAPTYQNQYGEAIQGIIGGIVDRPAYDYNYETDPVYQAYANQYRREGARAQENALAQAAARTGGQASTSALAASNQAGQYYASKLSDAIPALEQIQYDRYTQGLQDDISRLGAVQSQEQADYMKFLNAMQQYNTDRGFAYDVHQGNYNQAYNTLGAYQNAENMDFQKYNTQLGQFNQDRNFDYNKYLTQLGQYNTDRDFDYNQYLTQLNQYNQDRNFGLDEYQVQLGQYNADRNYNYNQYQDALGWDFNYQQANQSQANTEYDRQMDIARLAAQMGDYSLMQQLGINPDLAMLSGGGSVGSGGSGGSGGGGSGGGSGYGYSGYEDSDVGYYTTSFVGPDGQTHTGYVINGQTYTQPIADQQYRVPVGSIVTTQGGVFQMTENGGVPYIPAQAPTTPASEFADPNAQRVAQGNVMVQGYGWMNPQQLQAFLERGQVIRTETPQGVQYIYNNNPTNINSRTGQPIR